MSNPKQLVKLLNDGILPDELNFGLEKSTEFDINDLKFNWFYKDYSFYESKFPVGYESIPGFDNIIQSMADNQTKLPLEEIEERQNSDIGKVYNEGADEKTLTCTSTIGLNKNKMRKSFMNIGKSRKYKNSHINIDDKVSSESKSII
jgi:hypothetical protein